MSIEAQTRTRPAVWFPAIRAGTGVDVFTQRLCDALNARGIRAAVTWLPHRAEYLPWTVRRPVRPSWANVTHVNTWLHRSLLAPGTRVVATMHHNVHSSALTPFKRWPQRLYHSLWVRPLEEGILRVADCVTSVSHHTAIELKETFGTSSVVIHNGIDLQVFRPPEHRSQDRAFRLLYVGSWSTRKGTDLLAPIMRALGDGFELAYTATPGKVPDPNLPANCRNIGKPELAQLVAAYQQADALLFPSRLEGFGQVVAEAMGCGLPVIAGRNSALPEVIESGRTGVLIDGEDIGRFATAIRTLRDDPELRQRMSVAARQRVQAHFDLERMADRYALLYQGMIDHDSRQQAI